MKRSLLALGLSMAIRLSQAQTDFIAEPEDFNVTAALLAYGVSGDLLQEVELTTRAADTHPTCSSMCDILSATFGTQTYRRSSSKYETFRSSYWSDQQAEVEPLCVFEPSSVLQLAVGVLTSRLTQCAFAAKSGGHAAFASASSIQDGVSISLANFNQINIAKDLGSVDVGPGNKWQAVYDKVEPQGIVVLGGRDGDIGVGGLTTGGGVSLFASEYGWVCDNVISFQVLTAWGLVVEASSTSHADLYWALRGGGNNFGLVTNFKLRAFKMGKIWGGATGWGQQAFPALIQAHYNLGVNSPSDPKAAAILSFSATGGPLGNIAQTLLSYSLPLSPSILKDYTTIPSPIYNTTSVRSFTDYSKGFATWPAGTRDEIWTHTSFLNVEFMTFVKDTLFDIVPRIQAQTTGLRGSVSFQALTKGMLDHMKQNGGNPLGLADKKAPLLMLSQAWIWENAADDDIIYAGIREYQSKVEAKAAEMRLDAGYRYMNYANIYQDVIASYGSANKQRLKQIAAIYDPTGIWQRLQPGYFKLEGAPADSLKR